MAWIASLWSSSSFWECLEYLAEATVIVGALIEVLAGFEHILKGENNKELRKRIEKGAAIALVVGLAVGLGALVRTNQLFTETIASLYGEARDANNRATDALGKAKSASDKATLAEDRADRSERKSADAIVRASKNEKEAAILRKKAEDEAMARVKIEETVAWRRLTNSQISEMGSKLAAFPHQLTALVYNTGDLEAYSFASDIDTAIHEFAKWNVGEPQAILQMREGPVPFGTNPPLETGVVVRSTADERSGAAAKAVIEELSGRGFDASPGELIRSPNPTVEIFVEHRPEGPQGAAKLRSKGKSKP